MLSRTTKDYKLMIFTFQPNSKSLIYNNKIFIQK